VNIRFEAVCMAQPRAVLDQLYADQRAEHAAVRGCIHQLEQDPYPPTSEREPLYLLGSLLDPEAFVCGHWRISFHVEDDAFVVIDWLAQIDRGRV
jgi:hypothetical protein